MAITDEVCSLAEFGGSMSGEHGDGLARSHLNERLFGSELYQAFRKIKAAFDPHNLFNPGKVVDAPAMTENLRYGAAYRTAPIQTYYDFTREGGFAGAVEMCTGMGICRKTQEGTMCPSYMVTKDEEHSTRGRANALRAALSGQLPLAELTSKRMHDVLDLCLECKGCKGECPANVDMAKIKYEFLAHYQAQHGVPLRSRMFAHIETLNRWGVGLHRFELGDGQWHYEATSEALGNCHRADLPALRPDHAARLVSAPKEAVRIAGQREGGTVQRLLHDLQLPTSGPFGC